MKPKHLLCLSLVLSGALPGAAQTPYTYEIANGKVTITAHNGDVGAVTIPETINGLPVASIGGQSFGNDWEVNHVTIPNSVTSIGVGAFDGC